MFGFKVGTFLTTGGKHMIHQTSYGRIILTVMALAAGIMTSRGQENAPVVPDQVRKLDKFIGTWKAELVYNHDNKSDKIMSTMTFRSISGGFGVYADETSTSPVLGTMKGADLLGYDPFSKEIHCYTVDNMGTTHDHICQWKTDNDFYLEHNSMREGRKYQEKILCSFMGNDKMSFKADAYLDGKLVESTSGTYTRVP
jgi:hypothetical protein